MNSESLVRNTPVDGSFRIVPRAEHAISRKSISPGALRVLYRLHEAGFRACLVGGAVRDLLLGGHPKDFDVATDATPEQVRAQFRNCRLIGRRFRLAHVVFGREIVEVATFRGSSDDGSGDRHLVDGRLVRDNVYGSIEEDAVRRDFTVNALYYDIADFSVRDSVGGMDDLARRTLRLIGDPELRYREDPVRMLRAARLAAKLDFEIAPETAAPFATLGALLAEAPPARLFDESLKLFLSGYGLASFRTLERYGLLQHVFPATAHALSGDGSGAFRLLLEQTLVNTDARVRQDKPVTPAFLFAAMLWEPVRATAQALIDGGSDASIAWPNAAARVLREQAQRVAIPRRFTLAVEEIWSLQPRFASRTKKRVFRLMEHPRFRAAYDFLLLRVHESAELAELAQWWTDAQQVDPGELAAQLNAAPAVAEETAPPKKRKRRRRRKAKSAPQASGGE
ncbi:polynucleotide adenylyltransferase PcnB [Dokdonella ginsengisoli]|uniref:Poly(A) polymerase I n=1 Tax=Dokdonella ginsengisoli TaxID=363846 RepID=A0ABV9QY70_9GAMM